MWPLGGNEHASLLARLQDYAVKATREAMVHTRWTLPNTAHEDALKRFVASILQPGAKNSFLRDFLPFQQRIARSGMINGLSQAVLKIVSPGIPDFYQGSELWDLRLVDPDNRQPVDFATRASMHASLRTSEPSASLAEQLTAHWQDGRIKLYAIWKALNFRREHTDLFFDGDFLQLETTGVAAEHVLAIARRKKEKWALFAAPRWLARAQDTQLGTATTFWDATTIQLPESAPQYWRNIFTEENLSATGQTGSLPVAGMFRNFPIALLTGGTK
jgi:(1->4)-alpha-D-glucan 1-alpha-D-glucosylmutase